MSSYIPQRTAKTTSGPLQTETKKPMVVPNGRESDRVGLDSNGNRVPLLTGRDSISEIRRLRGEA